MPKSKTDEYGNSMSGKITQKEGKGVEACLLMTHIKVKMSKEEQ
jgi:hypothetical protein